MSSTIVNHLKQEVYINMHLLQSTGQHSTAAQPYKKPLTQLARVACHAARPSVLPGAWVCKHGVSVLHLSAGELISALIAFHACWTCFCSSTHLAQFCLCANNGVCSVCRQFPCIDTFVYDREFRHRWSGQSCAPFPLHLGRHTI